MKQLLLVTLLIVAACTAPAPAEPEPVACCMAMTASCLACAEGLSVEEYCAGNPETIGCEPEPAPEWEAEPEAPEFDEALQELQVKGAATTNYEFSYAVLPENTAQRTYYVRDSLVRVELFQPSLREVDSYDVIYLDLEERRAVGYCELGTDRICPNRTEIIDRPDFDTYYVELPHEFIGRLDNGAITGSVTYDNFVSDVVSAEGDGEYWKITINRFHGIPMKVEVYDNPEHTGEASGQQNRDFGFNTVSEEQVIPPSGW